MASTLHSEEDIKQYSSMCDQHVLTMEAEMLKQSKETEHTILQMIKKNQMSEYVKALTELYQKREQLLMKQNQYWKERALARY